MCKWHEINAHTGDCSGQEGVRAIPNARPVLAACFKQHIPCYWAGDDITPHEGPSGGTSLSSPTHRQRHRRRFLIHMGTWKYGYIRISKDTWIYIRIHGYVDIFFFSWETLIQKRYPNWDIHEISIWIPTYPYISDLSKMDINWMIHMDRILFKRDNKLLQPRTYCTVCFQTSPNRFEVSK